MHNGFHHDPLADIQDLRNLLGDQYDFHSILKELIQNADDSGSKELHLALAPGWPDAVHPLLRGPALVVANDGEFRPADAKGFRSLRLGTRGGDAGTIGKFGLGMKSVFHLCEAFFSLGSAGQPALPDGERFRGFLNPWSGSRHHEDWDETGAAFGKIEQWVSEWPHGMARWFLLWIPLRRQSQLGTASPIIQAYPKPEHVLGPEAGLRSARLYSLLRNLAVVTVWPSRVDGPNARRFSVRLDGGSSRRLFPEPLKAAGNTLRGRILGDGSNPFELRFVGIETEVRNAELTDLETGDRWPTTATINPRTTESIMVRDKATRHAAVVIQTWPAFSTDPATLRVASAVFLPLADEFCSIPIGGRRNYDLLLHGCFFLDAGRRHVVRQKQEEAATLASTWNRIIEQHGTFRLLLPALEAFVRAEGLSVDETTVLTEALGSARPIVENGSSVCAVGSWLRAWSPTEPSWMLIPSETPFWEIPKPPAGDDGVVAEVFPAIASMVRDGGVVVTDNGNGPVRFPLGGVLAVECRTVATNLHSADGEGIQWRNTDPISCRLPSA